MSGSEPPMALTTNKRPLGVAQAESSAAVTHHHYSLEKFMERRVVNVRAPLREISRTQLSSPMLPEALSAATDPIESPVPTHRL
jgi:hypothetical protein